MHRLIASTFGIGLLPRRVWGTDSGAGTFGAALAAGVGLLLLVAEAPWWIAAVLAVVATAASVWAARPFVHEGDPGWVCMDETAGTFLAMIGLGGIPWVAAVVVARLADIFKVLPGVRQADELGGTTGIVLDDLVAGAYGLAVGWTLTGLGVG